jgi:hypothetical protein
MMSTSICTGITVTTRQSRGVFAPERGVVLRHSSPDFISFFIYHVCILTDQSLTDTTSTSIVLYFYFTT